MTLNGLIPIKTVKNIIISINNNAFVHSRTGSIKTNSIKPNSIKPGTVRSNNKNKSTTYFYNNNNNVNIENLTVNINFLNCYFNKDYRYLVVSPFTYFPPIVCNSFITFIPFKAAIPLILTLTTLCYRTL